MIKKILIVGLIIILGGCTTTPKLTQTIDQSKVVVITPSANLYYCPQIKNSDIPNPDTATNQQVADFIKLLRYNLRVCGININKIEEYINEAKANYES